MIKRLIVFLYLIATMQPACFGFERIDIYKIEASKNASRHNNLGLEEMAEKNYQAAIDEFSVAIKLNPNTQATAIYYNNLGEAYFEVYAFNEAQMCFEKAISQYNLNFLFYQNLVKTYKAKNIISSKIKEYKIKGSANPLSKILLGLCYAENHQLRNAIITLDEFCMSEPNLIITPAVKQYIKKIVKQLD